MANFSIQHIAKVPKGWHVRTVTHPSGHEARIAFPPGPRKRGAGRLVEVLHPNREKNPEPGCIAIYELAAGHAGPPEAGSPEAEGIAKGIKEIALAPHLYIVPDNGSKANPKTRTREQVEKMQEKAVAFLERIGEDDKADEIEGLTVQDYADKKHIRLSNPGFFSKLKKAAKKIKAKKNAKGKRPRRNLDEIPAVQKVYETFMGKKSGEITELDEPDARRDDFAMTGWLVFLVIQPYGEALEGIADPNELSEVEKEISERHPSLSTVDLWDRLADEFGVSFVVIDFSGGQKVPEQPGYKTYGDGVRVGGAASGNQLYFLGGKQDISGLLGRFDVDTSKDFVGLGFLAAYGYLATKHMPGDSEVNDKPIVWQHIMGEEGGEPPLIFYNKLQKRLFLVGGTYSIEAPGITN